jgi:hypothetical protein
MNVNNCILIPNRHNWDSKPKLTTRFESSVAVGVTGAEDRQSDKDTALRSMDWNVTAATPEENSELESTLKSALASGRAASPLWPRQQQITGAATTGADTLGLWPWAVGENAFLSNGKRGKNIDCLVNCGGGTVGDWQDDKWGTGGVDIATGFSQDVSLVDMLPAPPEAVYQSARSVSSATPTSIIYTIPNMKPGIPCRVRLHFSEIGSGFSRSTYMRLQDVIVTGETSQRVLAFEPYAWAEYQSNTAVYLDFVSTPNAAGNIVIQLYTARREVAAIATSNVANPAALTALDGVTLNSGDIYCLANQNDSTKNGIYRHGEYPVRVEWANTVHALDGLEFIVKDPATHGGQWFRCSNYGTGWAIGANAILFPSSPNTLHYHAIINAIQVYQHTWDVVQLTTGTTTGHIAWSGWTPGVYDNGRAYPLIYGRLNAVKVGHKTNYVAQYDLTISEPVGDGAQGTPGLCPVETCDGTGWDELIWVDPPELTEAPTGTLVFNSDYVWGGSEVGGAAANFFKSMAIQDFQNNGGDLNKIVGIIVGPLTPTNHIVASQKWNANDFAFDYAADAQTLANGGYMMHIENGLAITIVYNP